MPFPIDIAIRRLERGDLPFAQEVRELAGWNQTDRDWERLLTHEPEGCFLATLDGAPAGTATTTTHGDEVGWIGMVLVHPDLRKRGVATQLLVGCIEYLERKVRCIKLDATPAGLPVYEKLGFVEESHLARWEGRAPRRIPDASPDASTLPLSLDRKAFGADRAAYLVRLARDSTSIVRDDGYAFFRPGSRANYLGPVVARTPGIGRELVLSALATRPGEPVFWDIPEGNGPAQALARDIGFSLQRPLVRMRLGERGHEGSGALQWAIGAPETG